MFEAKRLFVNINVYDRINYSKTFITLTIQHNSMIYVAF